MTFKLLGVLTGSQKDKAIKALEAKAKKSSTISQRFKSALDEIQALNLNIEDTEYKTAEGSLQWFINGLDWQIKRLFNRDNIKSYKVTSSALILDLVGGVRIMAEPSHIKDHQRYRIWGPKTFNYTRFNFDGTSTHIIKHEKKALLIDADAKPQRFNNEFANQKMKRGINVVTNLNKS